MLPNINNKHKTIMIVFILLLLLFTVYNNYVRERKTVYILSELNEGNENNELTSIEDMNNIKYTNKKIMVHVEGEVVNPGIYTLSEEARVFDAIEAAGGLKDTADRRKTNLAKKVIDEEFIYISAEGDEEFQNIQLGSNTFVYSDNGGLININKASKSELEGLPGIGTTLADRIIEHRNQMGTFNSIEDIQNVSGIGEKKYADIKDRITVK
ncbi:competence protein ComEA [Anaerovirgula multivorans]|uniref:Competence protein ComEA n=1 Tax=Anaerovirgula multivorans TaxID=312168 RepID=A0A239DQA5_9FIRM|nr:helix-hairpin-helix domain-containing protein [Anaerovirgula multivorans]SNS34517.1 competence protein ComEA [Anaerovirgula multivorans]